ncbi:MAG: hypothetical protein MI749_17015, partial [Desulfovibrionales bacterium]|nr:hypothetical protein [Desulfovibrionales bacterium]
SLASTEITMEKAKDFKQYFTPLDAHGSVGQYQGSGGQTISGVAMENLEQKREAGAHRDHHQGSFLFKQTDLIQKTWKKSHRLDYDVQVKVASNNALLYGAMGIDIRKQKKGEGLYQGFGISFVKFHESPLPGHGSAVKIHFNHGVAPFHPGQRIDYYHFPGWDDWNFIANGRILKAHNENVPGHNYHFKGWITLDPKSIWPTHAFDNFHAGPDDYIHLESGFYGAEVTGVNPPQTALDDFIPDGIKPPNMGSALLVNPHIQFPHWDQDNETEVVLLVLWQQKVVGHKEKRRWLAYKDLTHDIHLKGKQDYMDGRIVNDGATLLVRVREKMKSNQKINEIQVFYADASRVHPWQERTKTPRAHDIGQNRMAYRPGFSRPDQPRPPEGWAPLWPPKNMETWAADYNRLDYFSHIERPHGENSPEAFQWDGLADTSGEIDSWENAGKALFQLTSHGKILISDFTTPEGGNYAQPEIALTGFFDSATQWPGQEYNQPLIVFTDFSIRFFGPKKGARGFMTAIQK